MSFRVLGTRVLSGLFGTGIFLLVGCFCDVVPVRAEFAITEFAASNSSGLTDEDGDFSDWIEIYNPDAGSASLEGWFLTDDASDLKKWRFPAVTVQGHGFLVVFASEKNRVNPSGKLHTNFKLEKSGEYLGLVRPNGTVAGAFSPAYPRQVSGLTFGRAVSAENDWPVTLGQPRLSAGTEVPPGDWVLPSFDDASWTAVTQPVGYYRPDLATPEQTDPLVDVTTPDDSIVGTSANSPANEEVEKAIDNSSSTKYLNFDKLNAGFTVRPAKGATVVSGLRLTSANDAPDRDPTSFVLSGSNDGQKFVEIARGAIPAFTKRFDTVEVRFPNTTSYTDYRLIFPTVQNANAAVAMQIAEVEFLGRVGESTPEFGQVIASNIETLMLGKTSTAYLRVPFRLNGTGPFENLALRVRYEDGFVAWLNGTEIARANANLQSSTLTNRSRSAAVKAETFDLGAFRQLLLPGANVLAVQGLNESADSADFLIEATLENRRLVLGAPAYFTEATPGRENGTALAGLVSEVIVSPGRGVYDRPIDVVMTCPTEETEIRYTLDGSAPTATTGTVYSSPVRIDRTSVVRVGGFRNGWLPSPPVTHTFIFPSDVVQQQTRAQALAAGFPATWNAQAADYGLDTRVVGPQDNYGGKYRASLPNDLRAIPSMSIVMRMDDMFGPQGIYANPQQRGAAWERPASLELIYPDQRNGFQENAGIRIQGGAFRMFGLTLKKSFRIIFREEYGSGMLNYPLFGKDAAQEFNNFILRANSNDAWPYANEKATYIRDTWAMDTVRAMGEKSSHSGFVHLYINGLYWGLYNPAERPDAGFGSSYFGSDRDDWDAINQDSAPDGNYDAWNRLQAAAAQGLADNERYQFIQGNNPDGTRNPAYENLVDIKNMIDYMIMNIYVGNTDWPQRNWWAGRDRNGADGFRFFPWDTETALGFTSIDTDRTGVNGQVATVYAAARANADFRMQFADQVHRHFSEGGAFYVDAKNAAWDPAHPERNVPAARFAGLSALVEQAIVGETARWGDQLRSSPFTRDEHWKEERDRMLRDYFPRRSAIVLEQLRKAGLYPRTEAPRMNQRGGEVPSGFLLELSAPAGSIFYTTNGTEPRAPVVIKELSRTTLVSRDAAKKVFVPPSNGPAVPNSWREPGFPDSSWKSGTGGVGYDRETTYKEFIQTDVKAEMDNANTTAMIRIPFTYDGTGQGKLNFMLLRMQYDDGFAAFLNGVPIASANAPASLNGTSAATTQHADGSAVILEDFNADAGLVALRTGENILAIHGLNVGLSSSDFLIGAELVVGERSVAQSPIAAFAYTGPIQVTDGMKIKARAVVAGEWSALEEATFTVGVPSVVITEVHYHPANATATEAAAGFTDDSDFEFLELYNNGTGSAELAGYRFTSGIQFEFGATDAQRLLPGEYLVLVRNRAAFGARYGAGVRIGGEYSGRLDNGGERIILQNAKGTIVADFSYGTQSPWAESSDGAGYSLERVNFTGDPQSASSWSASAQIGGSPGTAPSVAAPTIESAVIGGTTLKLTFQGRNGAQYSVLSADSLPGVWNSVQSGARLTQDQAVQMEVTIRNAGQQFFRLGVD